MGSASKPHNNRNAVGGPSRQSPAKDDSRLQLLHQHAEQAKGIEVGNIPSNPINPINPKLTPIERQQLLMAGVIVQDSSHEFALIRPGDKHHARALASITYDWNVCNRSTKGVTDAVYTAMAEQQQVIDFQNLGSKAAVLIAKPMDQNVAFNQLVNCLDRDCHGRWNQDFLHKQLGWPVINGNTIIVGHPNPTSWSKETNPAPLCLLAVVYTNDDPEFEKLGETLPAFYNAMTAVHEHSNMREKIDLSTPITYHGTRFNRFVSKDNPSGTSPNGSPANVGATGHLKPSKNRGARFGMYVERRGTKQAQRQELAARLKAVAPGLAGLEKRLLPQAAKVRHRIAVLSGMPADYGGLSIRSPGCEPISRDECPAPMIAASEAYVSLPHMDESAGNIPETILFHSALLQASSKWCFVIAGARAIIPLAPKHGSTGPKTTFVSVPASVPHGTPFIDQDYDEPHTGIGVAICSKQNLVWDIVLPDLHKYWETAATQQLLEGETAGTSDEETAEIEYIDDTDINMYDTSEELQLPEDYDGIVFHDAEMEMESSMATSSLNLADSDSDDDTDAVHSSPVYQSPVFEGQGTAADESALPYPRLDHVDGSPWQQQHQQLMQEDEYEHKGDVYVQLMQQQQQQQQQPLMQVEQQEDVYSNQQQQRQQQQQQDLSQLPATQQIEEQEQPVIRSAQQEVNLLQQQHPHHIQMLQEQLFKQQQQNVTVHLQTAADSVQKQKLHERRSSLQQQRLQQQHVDDIEQQGVDYLQQQHQQVSQLLQQHQLGQQIEQEEEQKHEIHVTLQLSPTQVVMQTQPEHNPADGSGVSPGVIEIAGSEIEKPTEDGGCQQLEQQEPLSPQGLSQHLMTPVQTGHQQAHSSGSSQRTVTAMIGPALHESGADSPVNGVVIAAVCNKRPLRDRTSMVPLHERRVANVWKDCNQKARRSSPSKRPADNGKHSSQLKKKRKQ